MYKVNQIVSLAVYAWEHGGIGQADVEETVHDPANRHVDVMVPSQAWYR